MEETHISMVQVLKNLPNISGWRDTLQLNYRSQELRNKMTDILLEIAQVADGVRFHWEVDFPYFLVDVIWQCSFFRKYSIRLGNME